MLNGWFADNRCPAFVSDTQEPDDLMLLADALPKLASAGARIPLSYVNRKLKIPEPEGDEPILTVGGSAQPAEPPQSAATRLAALAANPAETVDIDPTSSDSQTEQLAREAGGEVQALVDQIAALAADANSLEILRDRLLESYGDLDSAKLVNVMALGFAAAELSGRFDVDNEG